MVLNVDGVFIYLLTGGCTHITTKKIDTQFKEDAQCTQYHQTNGQTQKGRTY